MIYTSEKRGSDGSGDGSLSSPFKSVLQALRAAGGQDPLPTIKVDAKTEGEVSPPWHGDVVRGVAECTCTACSDSFYISVCIAVSVN